MIHRLQLKAFNSFEARVPTLFTSITFTLGAARRIFCPQNMTHKNVINLSQSYRAGNGSLTPQHTEEPLLSCIWPFIDWNDRDQQVFLKKGGRESPLKASDREIGYSRFRQSMSTHCPLKVSPLGALKRLSCRSQVRGRRQTHFLPPNQLLGSHRLGVPSTHPALGSALRITRCQPAAWHSKQCPGCR